MTKDEIWQKNHQNWINGSRDMILENFGNNPENLPQNDKMAIFGQKCVFFKFCTPTKSKLLTQKDCKLQNQDNFHWLIKF